MAGRLGLTLLGATALSLTAGCYRHHTADEEVEEVGPWDDDVASDGAVAGDSAVAVSDATVARDGGTPTVPTLNCQNPADAIQQAICRAQGMQPGAADAGSGQPSLQDILEDILGGGGGQIPGLGGTGQIPGLGGVSRDAGTGRQTTGGLNCANASDQFTRILCGAMSGTDGQTRRDGGTQVGGANQFADLLEALQDVDCEREQQGLAALICLFGQFARDGGVGSPTGGRGNAGSPGGGGNQRPRGL